MAKLKKEPTTTFFITGEDPNDHPFRLERKPSSPVFPDNPNDMDDHTGVVVLSVHSAPFACRAIVLGRDPDKLNTLARALLLMASELKDGQSEHVTVDSMGLARPRITEPVSVPLTTNIITTGDEGRRVVVLASDMNPTNRWRISNALERGCKLVVRLDVDDLSEQAVRGRMYKSGAHSTRIVHVGSEEYSNEYGAGRSYLVGWGRE